MADFGFGPSGGDPEPMTSVIDKDKKNRARQANEEEDTETQISGFNHES